LIETTGLENVTPQAVLNPDSLIRLQTLVRSMPVGEKVLAAAYFGGDDKSLKALAASNKEIEKLVRGIM